MICFRRLGRIQCGVVSCLIAGHDVNIDSFLVIDLMSEAVKEEEGR